MMKSFILLDAGLGNIVVIGDFLSILLFLICGIIMIVVSVWLIRRELKNERSKSKNNMESPEKSEEHENSEE